MMQEREQQAVAGTLFDEIVRADGTPARHAESSYAFMNRVNRPSWQLIRSQLEKYFREFPTSDAADLINRFKDVDPRQHYPAWWELYLFALYRSLGYSVTPHPDVAGTSKKPDFLLTRDGEELYLEGAVVFSGIVEEGRNDAREAWIYDLVNEATNSNFHVSLEFGRLGTQRPKRRELIEPLEQWLNTLDPDEVSVARDNGIEEPEFCLSVRDWELIFTAHPVMREHRGRAGNRLLGMYPPSGGAINDQEQLRKTLDKKAGRYGTLDKPFIIAVLGMSTFMDNQDVENALFGRVMYRYSINRPHDGQWFRNRDGLWMRGNQPRATRVSGVLIGTTISPWNHTRELPRLWTNPWAQLPLGDTEPFPTATGDDTGAITYADTNTTAYEVFGVPNDWPGSEPRFIDTEPSE